MHQDKLSLLLALWGAILSTLLAVFQILESRRRTLRDISIEATVPTTADSLRITLANVGSRPVTVRSVALGYGHLPTDCQTILEVPGEFPHKLEEGDVLERTLSRSDLAAAVSSANIEQGYYHWLFVLVHTAHGRRIAKHVSIPVCLLGAESYGNASPYVATDVFLGFSPMESQRTLTVLDSER
jgi:hypothetical protein